MSWGRFNRHSGGAAYQSTNDALDAELARARAKFPGNRFLVAACAEELGEMAAALLQRRDPEEIRREALQVACVALRIYEEGDASFEAISPEESKP